MAIVAVTRRIIDASLLRQDHDVRMYEGDRPMSRADLLEFVAGADAILSMLGDRVDGELMDAAGPQLKAIANYAVGFNNVDLAEAGRRKIAVGNTPDVLTDATADIAVGLMLAAGRLFGAGTEAVRTLGWRDWDPTGRLGVEFAGKNLGIVGIGRIGEAVARRLHFGWGMQVLYTSRSAKPRVDAALAARRVELDELLEASDVISLHCDLNEGTRHLIDARALDRMKKSAVLVNTARGGVVDQDALYDALAKGKIFAAGLDVTDPEPLPADSPLRELSNCYILPHIGSATFDARIAMARRAAENIIAALRGEPMPYAVKTG